MNYLIKHTGLHSKNSLVRFDPEKSPRGPDPFWGQTYLESRSDWPGIQVRLTRNPSQKEILDSDSGNFYPDSRSVWPRNGSGPMGPFSGSNLTREFLECTPQKVGNYFVWTVFILEDKIKLIVYHPTQELTNLYIIVEPAAIWDSSRPIVIGQARWSRG